MAERVGFEPTLRLPVNRISSAAHSTTLPPLRKRAPGNGLEGRRVVEGASLADEWGFAKHSPAFAKTALAQTTMRLHLIGMTSKREPPSAQNAGQPLTNAARLLEDAEPVRRISHARFTIGDVVRHRLFGFRGVIFDIDPSFANSEEWYAAIPEAIRPDRDQPFYHLLAENAESSYIAYVSQQNLLEDRSSGPVHHPAVPQIFTPAPDGRYNMHHLRWH